MLFNAVINLVSITDSTNTLGDTIKVPTQGADIFADKQSVKRAEFYQAAASGLRPEMVFVIRLVEYNGEQSLFYNFKAYNIIRTYEKDTEFIELVCSGVVNNATS